MSRLVILFVGAVLARAPASLWMLRSSVGILGRWAPHGQRPRCGNRPLRARSRPDRPDSARNDIDPDAGLPDATFVVGFEIRAVSEESAAIEQQPAKATVALTLSNSTGTILFAMTAVLNEWTWSVPPDGYRAFVYGRGEPGTYFLARSDIEYTLTLGVFDPEPGPSKYVAVLLARSPGWK